MINSIRYESLASSAVVLCGSAIYTRSICWAELELGVEFTLECLFTLLYSYEADTVCLQTLSVPLGHIQTQVLSQ